ADRMLMFPVLSWGSALPGVCWFVSFVVVTVKVEGTSRRSRASRLSTTRCGFGPGVRPCRCRNFCFMRFNQLFIDDTSQGVNCTVVWLISVPAEYSCFAESTSVPGPFLVSVPETVGTSRWTESAGPQAVRPRAETVGDASI